MTQIFFDITMYFAGVAASLTLIDWFLSDQRKHQVADACVRIWDYLDSAKKKRLLLKFTSGRPQYILGVMSLLLAPIIILKSDQVLNESEHRYTLVAIAAVISVVVQVKWILPCVLRYLSEADRKGSYASRLLLATVAAAVFGAMGLGLAEVLRQAGLVAFDLFATAVVVFTLLAYDMMLVLAMLTLGARLGLFVARFLLAGAELIMRRIAESSKGPVLALSVLVGAIAGVLKVVVS